MILCAELHCHTRFSDGLASPVACVARARSLGLDVLAVTDHNTADGGLAAQALALSGQSLLVIPGEEVSTDIGHVLVYFLRETIPPGPFEAVMEQVQQQAALAFLAHPYHIPLGNRWRKKRILKAAPNQIDRLSGIEVENGHNRTAANRLAWQLLAAGNARSAISGSDAHVLFEIGNALTLVDCAQPTLQAVKEALAAGRVRPQPRKYNAYPVYLLVGLLNRLRGQNFSYPSK